ncbi:MINI-RIBONUCLEASE 3 [Salix viminalis]|uniref:MINI-RIBONUCLEASE 3 n=1 Tax=Salix viminalis TaxID=40686 RepID=A0A9Q0TPB6_SALVM|nr:MINI-RIBONUCLEASE 3 [Salix viminalis]
MLFPQLLLPPQLSLSLLRQFQSFSNARLLLFKKNWMVHIWDMRGGCRVRPKVEKPRSVFNAASLAYIGDSIFELYARRHFLFPPLSIEEHNDRVMAVVRCEAQDALLQKLLNDNYLSEEERVVLRWGKNVGSTKTRTKRRVGVAVYNRASSLETLVGFLYLTNVSRLEEVMLKLGFSTDSSAQMILKEANTWDSKKAAVFWDQES